MKFKHSTHLTALALAYILAGCGAGSSHQGDQTAAMFSIASISDTLAGVINLQTTDPVTGAAASAPRLKAGGAAVVPPPTPAEASQFLAQATFGPTAAEIAALAASNKADWVSTQLNKPQTKLRDKLWITADNANTPNPLYEAFWRLAVSADDQLRQRVTFALSEIFVISVADSSLAPRPIGVASYYDMLGQYAFGNFRDLLQGVALHPMMGLYLSHLRNQKENGPVVPDENFAREIMQLMSIGLYQLNPDGTQKTENGKAIETYTHDDVAGLAKVFTGWSWAGPDKSNGRFLGGTADPARDWTPMQNYPAFHSTSAKSFLGTSIAGGGSGEAELKIALDTLFKHPNVGPFICRQLIQRIVTSNPSPAYVARVAAVFADNGSGVRGDLRAVTRAMMLDPEAAYNGSAKKLREPVLRLTHWMRSFNARTASGRFALASLEDPLTGLGQTALRAPSVFNFFRPTYTPPNSDLAAQGLTAPEMQITGEPSVTGYVNLMQYVIPGGIGSNNDVQANYSAELALAQEPAKLLDRVNLLLLGGSMSTTLRNQILGALNAVSQPVNNATAIQLDAVRKSRVYLAIYLTMVSPEYLAQR